jgi:hypothetical protein
MTSQLEFPPLLTVLSRVPQSEDIDSRLSYLVAHFIVADEDATNFSGLEFFQFLSNARVFKQATWRGRQ